MSKFLDSYVVVGLVALVPILMAFGTLTLGRFVRPSRPNAAKGSTYESGSDPVDSNWMQTHVRYYLYALLFVVFDVEVVFIVPWAVQVDLFGGFGLAEMFIFVAVLALGLGYAWRKGILEWDS